MKKQKHLCQENLRTCSLTTANLSAGTICSSNFNNSPELALKTIALENQKQS